MFKMKFIELVTFNQTMMTKGHFGQSGQQPKRARYIQSSARSPGSMAEEEGQVLR